jgi:hypothetical protein
MSSAPVNTALEYRCGDCGSALTDSSCLFTSCGHFFCAASAPGVTPCTRLVAGQPGSCEQCGATCNAGILANRAVDYDDRVRAYVFGNVPLDLRAAADILDFRAKHARILAENVDKLRAKNSKLLAKVARQADDLRTMSAENKSLLEFIKRNEMGVGGSELTAGEQEMKPLGAGGAVGSVGAMGAARGAEGMEESRGVEYGVATTVLETMVPLTKININRDEKGARASHPQDTFLRQPVGIPSHALRQSPSRKRDRDTSHDSQPKEQRVRRSYLRTQPSSVQPRGTELIPNLSEAAYPSNTVKCASQHLHLASQPPQLNTHEGALLDVVQGDIIVHDLKTGRHRQSYDTMSPNRPGAETSRSLRGSKRAAAVSVVKRSTEFDTAIGHCRTKLAGYTQSTKHVFAQSVSAVIPSHRRSLLSRDECIDPFINTRLARSRAGGRAGISAVPCVVPVAAASLARFAARSSSRVALVTSLGGRNRLGQAASTVPRPSATPDRFSRTVQRPRELHRHNLLGSHR